MIHDPGCSIPGIVCAEHCPWAASPEGPAEAGIGDGYTTRGQPKLVRKGPDTETNKKLMWDGMWYGNQVNRINLYIP